MLKDVTITVKGNLSSRVVHGIDITLHFNGTNEDVPIEVRDLSGRRNENTIELDGKSRVSIIHEVYAAALQHPGDFWPLIYEKLEEKAEEIGP